MKRRKLTGIIIIWAVLCILNSCGKNPSLTENSDLKNEIPMQQTEIQVFVAASLQNAMEEIAEEYHKEHPEVSIVFNADSSGTLQTQIQEGFECDIFFSADQKQMNALEADGLIVADSRADVVSNRLVVVTYQDSQTEVTGLTTLDKADSIALAGGSVPVGKYTRQALMALEILESNEDTEERDVAAITTAQLSDSLGGVEISEQSNVSKVLLAVVEQSCEVGTTYYSDTYGYEDELEILEYVSSDLSGEITYPICLVQNPEADEVQSVVARDFYEFVLSDTAKRIFDRYYFDTNVE